MAVRVEFSRDWDHRPHPSEVRAYKAGTVCPMPEDVAALAVASGAAVLVDPPKQFKAALTADAKEK